MCRSLYSDRHRHLLAELVNDLHAQVIGVGVFHFIDHLLERPGRLEARRRDLLQRGEAYFTRHGGKTVFFGRWLPVLRITAAWLAGAHHMAWPKFLAWNALGGIAWAISIGILAYLAGHTEEAILQDASYVALGGLVVILVAVSSWALWRRRLAS